jgi:hypothetical protein
MASQNKKNKQVNAYAYKTVLKHKGGHLKGLLFFTSSQRQENKKFGIEEE